LTELRVASTRSTLQEMFALSEAPVPITIGSKVILVHPCMFN
jgi:hypothetical protein